MAEVKYEGPLAPNENGRIIWPENLAELHEMSEGTLIPAMAVYMARTEADRERERTIRKEYDARRQHMEEKRQELTERYPDRWVTLTGDWELVVADSLPEIITKLDAKSARRPQPVTMFLNTKPQRWIL